MIIVSFTPVFPQTAIGSKRVITGMSFVRMLAKGVSGRPIGTVTGFGLIAVGSGIPTSILVGRRITTGVGFGSPVRGGVGYRVTHGRQPGYLGVKAANMSAGRRYLRKLGLASTPASPVGPILIME